ncbi:MAG TPA: ATP-binding protein [Acidimicrobiales bacterium]|nr:ATP-binding protein [Acidimicrobiales bacterium]
MTQPPPPGGGYGRESAGGRGGRGRSRGSAGDDGAGSLGLFTPRFRRGYVAWVVLTLPLTAVAGRFATTPDRYVVLFVLVSALYMTPALVCACLCAWRAPRRDRPSWWLWLTGIAITYLTGVGMLAGTVVPVRIGVGGAVAPVLLASSAVSAATVSMVKRRSMWRAVSVDLFEAAMSVIVATAPVVLLWGEAIVESDQAWFALPAAAVSAAMVFSLYWAVLLVVRVRTSRCSVIGLLCAGVTVIGLANGLVQMAQAVSGFTLPAAPLLTLQALSMALLSLAPLYVPRSRIGPVRRPSSDQVRGAWLPATLMLVGLPVLLVTVLVLRDRHPWAPVYGLVVTSALLVLGVLRQLAAVSETRRLYAQVEWAAEARRELLAQVMQRSDDDRHRVAAQLHEQAVSAYATFVSMVHSAAVQAGGAAMTGASQRMRDELGRQAESLRRLMLAVQPLEVDRPRSGSLSVPIRAYIDGLYRDRRPPEHRVVVDDSLELDWTTETVVLRIVQEAVRNVWRHSDATSLEVHIGACGGAVEVEVADDGAGFEPATALHGSGITAMRSFAALAGGTIEIDSAPGYGTRVRAVLSTLGTAADDDEEDGDDDGRPRLRLVGGGVASA